MHTSSRDVIKTLGRSAAALVCVAALASCTSGDSEAEADLCGISASSEEEALVREILGTADFETKTYKSKSVLADKVKRALPGMRPGKNSYFNAACRYRVEDEHRAVSATFSFGWSPRVPPGPPSNGVSYELDGASGVTSESNSTLLVQCDLPGELGAQSRNVWFSADAYFSFMPATGTGVVDQAGKDRRMTLTYLMTRRVTDALGCENKPLEKPPVVKPLPTP
ncbi:hypothetical protein ACFCXF_08825 [Streptomyces virginiae]|uniref:hypothetical protein n=1 Tax=Streptomyces virginiae TaxID=1961 RepID=UPI000B271C96|nr:hypothetical protein [Streptomyces virginiae]